MPYPTLKICNDPLKIVFATCLNRPTLAATIAVRQREIKLRQL